MERLHPTSVPQIAVASGHSSRTSPKPFAPDDLARLQLYWGAGLAANTRKAYESDWTAFAEWCAAKALTAMPAPGETVAAYLAAFAGSVSVATLARRLASIRYVHAISGQEIAPRIVVERVWAGIRRTHGRPPEQKHALAVQPLRALIRATRNDIVGVRDRALLLLGFAAALRRSELAGVSIGCHTHAIQAEFVSQGILISLTRSKSDQLGKGQAIGVPYGAHLETCPVRAVRRWVEMAGIERGALFRRITRTGAVCAEGIGPQTVASIIKRAAQAAGLDQRAYSGHSLRAGLATAAAEGNAPAHLIMRQMRHASFDTTNRYIRSVDMFSANAAAHTDL